MVRQAIQYILRGSLMSANRINEDNYIFFTMLKYRDNYKCMHKSDWILEILKYGEANFLQNISLSIDQTKK
jgi:hypothetical protein